MSDKKNSDRSKTDKSADTDSSLQDELSREAAEGKDSVGDVGSNRTLSGSSSWETLPEEQSGKNSGQAPRNPTDKQNTR